MDKVLTVLIVIVCATSQVSSDFMDIERNLRIVGGFVSRPSQFPHAAALILHLTRNRQIEHSFCGGSIIHQNFILTAAHCLDDVHNIEVLAGVHNIWGTAHYRANVPPRDIRAHPQYNRNTLINDIGLIHLLRRITFGSSMQRIVLPTQAHVNNRFVGSTGTVIGWGRTSDDSQALSDTLRFVQLPILGDQHCIDVYNTGFRYFNPSNICLSGERGSSCNGDSGSGLHLTLNGQMTLIGLVSYGSSNCEGGQPPVMTRITSYLEWIAANTGIRIL